MKGREEKSEQLAPLRVLLSRTWHKQNAEWAKVQAKPLRERLNKLAAEEWILNDRQVELALSIRGIGPGKWRPSMFLPPLKMNAGFVPLLFLPRSLEDFRSSDYQLTVALYDFDPGKGSIGFRFEGPHSRAPRTVPPNKSAPPLADVSDDEGEEAAHGYRHAQIVRTVRDGPTLPGCPAWLPLNVPAFPLFARGPADLLICILIGLYGLSYFHQEFNAEPEAGRYLQRLRDLKV